MALETGETESVSDLLLFPVRVVPWHVMQRAMLGLRLHDNGLKSELLYRP